MSIKCEQWVKRMRSWERSGQTRSAFCRSRGLNLHTFDYWRRALRSTSTELPSSEIVGKITTPCPLTRGARPLQWRSLSRGAPLPP